MNVVPKKNFIDEKKKYFEKKVDINDIYLNPPKRFSMNTPHVEM